MSGLLTLIPPPNVPIGTADPNGNVTIQQAWYLFLYNFANQSSGGGSSDTSNNAYLSSLVDMDADTSDIPQAYRGIANAELLALDEQFPLLAARVLGLIIAYGKTGIFSNSITIAGTDGKTLTINNNITLSGIDGTTMTLPPASASLGYIGVPQNSQSVNYTTVLADKGKCLFHPASDANARTFTIDSNANVAFPIGTIIEFMNLSANNLTIAITSDTLTFAPSGSTGSRTLAQYGRANAEKIAATQWLITGVGLT